MEENKNESTNIESEVVKQQLENERDINSIYGNSTSPELASFTENEVHSFTRLSDKYEDIKSSAYTMILVGAVGVILMILVINNIIPLPLNPETSWLFKSVLGSLFIIFIIAGIISFMHAKKVKIDALEEDKLIENILSWGKDNFTVDILDEGIDATQPEEIKYFGRADKIKNGIMHKFENADEALIYELTEELYQFFFENTDN